MKGFGWYRSKKLSGLTDMEVVSRYTAGHDPEFIGELFKRYHHLVFGVCLKYLRDSESAKDATLDIFETLPLKLEKQIIQHFSSWLHSLTRNHCLMQLRSATHQAYSLDEIQELQAQSLPYESEEQHTEYQLQRLESALQDLNEGQRRCIQLFYLERKAYQQISVETGFEIKLVKSHIQNAKRNLKIILSEKHEKETNPYSQGE